MGNVKVASAMLKMEVVGAKARKEYGYGNPNHTVRESREVIYELMRRLTQDMIKGAKLDIQVMGEENLPEKGPVLYVATHKGIFDIVVLTSLIKDPCIFIGKKEVSKMPIIHKWFDALGCIYIDREDKRQALQSIIQGINELKGGQSIVLFPEGTRTMSDEIKPFKEGGFRLATKTGVPIVPIALRNTYKVFEEKKGIRKTKVVVNIGKTIYTDQLSGQEQKQLPLKVEEVVRSLMQEIIDTDQ